MISFTEGFFDDEWSDAGVDLSLCELPAGLLEQIGRSIPGLTSINLKQCSGIDMLVPSGFLSLCDGCRHIRTVNLVGATTVSDTMLAGMHKLCGSLRVVLLGGCMNLTPGALVDFVRNAGRNLLELDLSGCQVNDFVVKEIVANCSDLVTLSMAYCDDVSCVAFSLVSSPISIHILPCALCPAQFYLPNPPLEVHFALLRCIARQQCYAHPFVLHRCTPLTAARTLPPPFCR